MGSPWFVGSPGFVASWGPLSASCVKQLPPLYYSQRFCLKLCGNPNKVGYLGNPWQQLSETCPEPLETSFDRGEGSFYLVDMPGIGHAEGMVAWPGLKHSHPLKVKICQRRRTEEQFRAALKGASINVGWFSCSFFWGVSFRLGSRD